MSLDHVAFFGQLIMKRRQMCYIQVEALRAARDEPLSFPFWPEACRLPDESCSWSLGRAMEMMRGKEGSGPW